MGLAIGDALGAAVEFQAPGFFEPVTGYRGGGPHQCCKAGDWTDDTSMALAMGDSLGDNGFDPIDQMCRYVKWMDAGAYTIPGYCFDIGNTTQRALMRFVNEHNTPYCGSKADEDSGNGSIMRLAPIPIYFADLYPGFIPKLLEYAKQSSETTHGSLKCISACQYMTVIMTAFMHGETKEAVLDQKHMLCAELVLEDQNFHPAIAGIVNGSYKSGKNIRGTGYVRDSLEAALWAFWTTNTFEEAVLAAVNLGDDADTTGAVCGQIAGSYYGESGIPKHLLDGLSGRDMIEGVLNKIT